MDIVIISQYLRNIENFDGNNSRFVYLANMLEENHNVEIITSDYLHGPKAHAQRIGSLGNVKVTALHEPGYSKNVCLKRFYSHKQLAKNISKYFNERKKPDVCYCAIPSLDVAYSVAQYCKKNNVRFIVDVQDLWPEAFKMVFHIPILSDIIFAPMQNKANKIYSQADEIVAVSNTYVNRVLQVNKKCTAGHAVYLGTNLDTFDTNAKMNLVQKNEKELWLGYCGTLGASYDLTCVFDALEILQNKGVTLPKFIVMGDGPQKQKFESYAREKKLEVVFTGSLPYAQMCGMLSVCDMVVNPISHGAAASIINKHADYAACGLPVLNTQECKEYRDLVSQYEMGYNCENNNAEDLAEKLEQLILDKAMRIEMGHNARRCAEERFDRKNSYKEILDTILK